MEKIVENKKATPKKGTKKKKGKKVTKSAPGPVRRFLRSDSAKTLLGIIFIITALFTLISLVSYLFTWTKDQSLLSGGGIFSSVVDVENLGGKLGYSWSNFLVAKLFGFGAFVIPVFFTGLAIYCFKRDKVNVVRLFFLSLMGSIVISLTFSYIFSFTDLVDMFGEGAGGSYGYYLNMWLQDKVGPIISGLLIGFLFLIWLMLLSPKVVDFVNRLFDSIFGPKSNPANGGDTESDEDENGGESEDDEAEDDDESEDEDEVEDDCEDGEDPFSVNEDASQEEDGSGDDDKNGEGPYPIIEVDDSDLGTIIDPDSSQGIPIEDIHPPVISPSENEGGEVNPPAGGMLPVENLGDFTDGDFSEGLTDDQWKERYDPRLSLSHYKMPHLGLLNDYADQIYPVSQDEKNKNGAKILTTLRNYKIEITKVSALAGPTVTLYEVVPAPNVRGASIKKLEDDIARSLAARGVRVVNIPGSTAIGIEVPNDKPSIVSMKSLLADPQFNSEKYALPVVMGRTISNKVMSFDLAKMPHLLVAGATGQGKSVGLNTIITSLLYKKHPSELKFVLVDPKKVELSVYEPIEKHYLAKLPDFDDAIITDTKKVVSTLRSLCKLMDHRYDLLKAAGVREVKSYNEKFLSRKLNPYRGHEYMPYIVVIIDEFADLLMTAGREVEEPIARLAQLARAVGIHLVIATQRPTTNIITGSIKANFTARIAFKVVTSVDSKTILDQTGANQLAGRGDMLIYTGNNDPIRVQCAFIDTPEVDRIAEHISQQQGFGSAYLLPPCGDEEGGSASGPVVSVERDELFKEAARLIVREQIGSTSLIQRKMQLGYNRAGRIMDQLEAAGIVGPSEGSKPRQVKIASFEELEDMLSRM